MKRNLLGISLLTVSCLYGMLALVIILIFIFTGFPVLYGIVTSIIVLIIQFLISPFLTDLSMKWFYGVNFNYEMPDYLKQFINQVCIKYNMKYPKIGFINDGAPNAFTYGRTKNDARIILTRGIFELLDEQEVISVVSHELGHATHYDMLFMTVAQLVPLLLYGIYESFSNMSNDDDKSASAIIGLIAYILYFISQYIILWLSRTREYYADSFAVQETRNPNALASALVKIGYGLSNNSNSQANNSKGKKYNSTSKSIALGIFDSKCSKSLIVSSYEDGHISQDRIMNAMKWEMWNVWAFFYELVSTHPLISKRLKEISKRSIEFNQTPYIEFNLQKPESFVDDFIAELFIKYLPLLTIIISLLLVCLFSNYYMLIIGCGGVVAMIFSLIKLSHRYKNKDYKVSKVSDLLGEVKVSDITSIPCIIKGKIIGRGNPGCIFNEDFVIKDDTGIIFLNYNQPLHLVNKLFALFKSKEYFDTIVEIKGWYRRSPIPYIEINSMKIGDKIKKCYTYIVEKVLIIITLIVFIFIILMSLI